MPNTPDDEPLYEDSGGEAELPPAETSLRLALSAGDSALALSVVEIPASVRAILSTRRARQRLDEVSLAAKLLSVLARDRMIDAVLDDLDRGPRRPH